MTYLIYCIVRTTYILLFALQILMLARAVSSWFIPDGEGSFISDFLYYSTEPVILPIRKVFSLFGYGDDASPIDIPFMVAIITLSLIEILLPTVSLA